MTFGPLRRDDPPAETTQAENCPEVRRFPDGLAKSLLHPAPVPPIIRPDRQGPTRPP